MQNCATINVQTRFNIKGFTILRVYAGERVCATAKERRIITML